MSLTKHIREQIISSFRAELTEHAQTLNDGLLALEQKKETGEKRVETLANLFRAAHSLKGAARAVGVSAVEQLAHALEDVFGEIQREVVTPSPDLFTACYQAIDAIQVVQASYETGETTPPIQVLKALTDLQFYRKPSEHVRSEKGQIVSKPVSSRAPVTTRRSPTKSTPRQTRSKKVDSSIAHNQKKRAAKPGKVIRVEGQPEGQFREEVQNETPTEPIAPFPVQIQASPLSPASDETIRVNVSKLDILMAQLSELLVTKIHAEQRLTQIHRAQGYMTQWQKEWLAVRKDYNSLARSNYVEGNSPFVSLRRKELALLLAYVDASQNRLRDISLLINNLSREYHSDTMQMSLGIEGLEEQIKQVRMLPLNTITGPFGRTVRDLSQASGKEVVLEIIGSEVELDKRVLEQIKDPIIHMLRNAIDHGIEPPEKRLADGKPAYGTITLSAEHQGKDVAISVRDDGAGLNIEAIRQAAVRRGVPNAHGMSDPELVGLIYNPGFSTSPIITDVSGRGVGLDVVRRNVEILRGRINLDWQPGLGSCFTLLIPLALTSTRGLLVRVSDQLFAIPFNTIERIEYVSAEDVTSVGGHDTIRFNGHQLILTYLGSVLNLPRTNGHFSKERIAVVILSSSERQMAFVVDEIVDEQEVVIKGLGKQLTRVSGIAGASIMGSGEVILILNVTDLIKLAQHIEQHSVSGKTVSEETEVTTKEHPQRRILVVDDSITTRTLEKNILEASGYAVQLAIDGQEALNVLMGGDLPDLIISDIAMPRLDGFDLAQRIKSDTRTANLPLILVTSMNSNEDKARGIECGADAYIVKSSFDQNNLLETIEQLI